MIFEYYEAPEESDPFEDHQLFRHRLVYSGRNQRHFDDLNYQEYARVLTALKEVLGSFYEVWNDNDIEFGTESFQVVHIVPLEYGFKTKDDAIIAKLTIAGLK